MIRINLLPVRAAKKRSTTIAQLIVMAAVLAIVGIMVFAVNTSLQRRIDEQTRQIAEADTEIKRLKKIIGEVKELDAQKKRLTAQLNVIKKLERGKQGPVHVLDDLSTVIPKRVWVTDFKEMGGTLNMNGFGLENADISEFMKALEKSKYFKSITLKFTEVAAKGGVKIYKFSLSCAVDYAA
jgi:type IV pilus assembly protein PilN